jgi:NADH-quinone oxidoreductase subunit H
VLESGVTAAVLPVALILLALGAAAFGGALDARAAGTSVSVGVRAPAVQAVRLLRQQRRTIPGADTLLWRIGGGGLVVAAVLQVVVVPLAGVTVADLPVGVVWFNAMDVLVWALWWLLGWGANSAWSLVGGYRFLAQALAYEIPLMFALTGPAIAARSLRMADVVAAQGSLWFVVSMPVAFLVFLVSVVAFSAWGPFATSSGTDAAGGVLAELSGVDRLLVLAGRYALLTAGAAVAVPLFLGGGGGPLLPAWGWVMVKTVILLGLLVAGGRAVPAIRPEKLAEVAWVVVLPLVLVQLLVTSVIAALGGS